MDVLQPSEEAIEEYHRNKELQQLSSGGPGGKGEGEGESPPRKRQSSSRGKQGISHETLSGDESDTGLPPPFNRLENISTILKLKTSSIDFLRGL